MFIFFRKISIVFLFSCLLGIFMYDMVGCKELGFDGGIKGTTLFDMRYIPSDYECLLLANKAYDFILKEGDKVTFDKNSFVRGGDYEGELSDISYLFLVAQFLTAVFLIGFLAYDFKDYLTGEGFDNINRESVDKLVYLGVVGAVKLVGLVVILADIPMAFASGDESKKVKRVYDKRDFRAFYKQGWHVLRVFGDERSKEYRSVLYINGDKTKLVLGMKGSSSWRDWRYTNWPAIVYQRPKGQVRLMLKLMEGCIGEAKRHNIDVLTIAGHSMGGFLGQICAFLATMHFSGSGVHVRCVAYDSPGAKTILDELNCNTENNRIELKDLDITNYVAGPNLINTMHDHTGSLCMVLGIDALHEVKVYRFPIFFVKLIAHVVIVFFVQLLLYMYPDKGIVEGRTRASLTEIYQKFWVFALPILFIVIVWGWLYFVHYWFLVNFKHALYSWDYHALSTFIRASDGKRGDIEAVEVSYFPKHGQEHEGPAEFFLDFLTSNSLYTSNIKEGPLGVCYVKDEHSMNTRFLLMRHLLPEVRRFLWELDKKYGDDGICDVIFELLGVPMHCVYDNRGVLQGVKSCDEEVDIRILMDRLAVLLRHSMNYATFLT